MNHRPASLSSLLVLTACLSGGVDPPTDSAREVWPNGTFHLMGTVTYDRNDFSPRNQASETHWFDLSVNPGPVLSAESTAGYCRRPVENAQGMPITAVSRAYRGPITWYCGEVTLTVRAFGSTLRGEMSVPFEQRVRRRGACLQYNEEGRCLRYDMIIESRRRRASAPLRIGGRGR
jgi:hypothetical protein